jgi:serine/threonine protein phosphatase PrpC
MMKERFKRYLCGAASDRGSIRDRNEDYYGIYAPKTDDLVDSLGILAVVSDGMGGHLSGAEASKKAVETLGAAYFADGTGAASLAPSPANRLRWAFLEANRAVYETIGEGHNGMAGTTCTAAVLLPDSVVIAHAGDSRAYIVRGRDIAQLTDDHSIVGEMVRKGILSDEEAARHPHRNVITRAMGLRGTLEVDIKESVAIECGDRILICSDGLFSMVREREIAEIAAKGSPEKACQKLVKRAKEEGGSDNVTVLIAEKIA